MPSSFGGYDRFSETFRSGKWDQLPSDEKDAIVREMKLELEYHSGMADNLKRLIEMLDELRRAKDEVIRLQNSK